VRENVGGVVLLAIFAVLVVTHLMGLWSLPFSGFDPADGNCHFGC
jgi:hypothetical protein